MLENAGLRFQCIASDVDESIPSDIESEEVPLYLARVKAQAVAVKVPNAVVIGADQIALHRGRILRKPRTAREARDQLAALSGSAHELVTGAVVLEPLARRRPDMERGGPSPSAGGKAGSEDRRNASSRKDGDRGGHAVVTRATLSFRTLDAGLIDAYVATGEWQGCVGGYRLEGRGVLLMEHFSGDYFSILGLPLVEVLGLLRRVGVDPLRP